jgi:hypothetical protein
MGNMGLNDMQEYYKTTFASDFQKYFIVERSYTSDYDFRIYFLDRRRPGRLKNEYFNLEDYGIIE